MKFYLLALYAMRLNPDDIIYTPQPDGSLKWEMKESYRQRNEPFPAISLWALGAVAYSKEEAKLKGMEKLMEACPWQEGWVNHSVTVNTISRDTLLRIVADATSEHNGDELEWPDVIM